MLDKELMLRKELESIPSEQLRVMLHAETGKDVPDDDLVLTILHILEDREPDALPTESDREEAAWKLYRKRVRDRKKRRLHWKGLSHAAVLLLVVGLLFAAIPHEAEADNWWNRIARWTDDFFAFFREEETFRIEEYKFQTDNPGLQQVYDAVVEMGITEPVVPMWLPEGYELTEIKVYPMRDEEQLVALFEMPEKNIIYQVTVLATDKRELYPKDEVSVRQQEICGTTFNFMRNNEIWIVVWKKDNVECSIAVDCQEDVLYEILDSLYFIDGGRSNETLY